MPFSSYQVERLIQRLRRRRGWLPGRTPRPVERDRVRLSPRARHPGEGTQQPTAPVDPRLVEAGPAEPPVVSTELERRAGLFMQPPCPPPQAPPRVFRLLRRRGPRPSLGEHVRGRGEAD